MTKAIKVILVLISCIFALVVVSWIFVFRKCSYNRPERILSEAQVSNYLSQEISEPCDLINKVRIPADRYEKIPPMDVYTYKSKDRDMFFHVTSTLEEIGRVLGFVPLYEPVIYDDHEISESNQATDDFWFDHKFDQDYYSMIIKIPVDEKEEADDYLKGEYNFKAGKRICVVMNNDCEMAGSMAAMYVSGIFTSSEDNKYPPYIRYDTMSVGDGEVTLKAEVRDYGDGGSGKEAYYVAVVFVRVDSLDTVIKGGFTNADYDAPDDDEKDEDKMEIVF